VTSAPRDDLEDQTHPRKVDKSLLRERAVTRREAEVLALLAERPTNAEIAERLFLSERTVESHVSALLRKLEVASRLELSELARMLADTSLGAPTLPPALELLADPSTFIGRGDDRARLLDLWESAAAGRTLVAIVSGEAGIGKSRLVAELAATVHAAGGSVLLGSCFEGSTIPYQPFVDALASEFAALNDDELRRRMSDEGPTLGRLLPDMAERAGIPVERQLVDSASGRAELLSSLYDFLARSARETPLLFVIEDFHWATATTRVAVRHLAQHGGRAPLLLVTTTRDTPPDLDKTLEIFLGQLTALPTVAHVRLSGLDETEVEDLIDVLDATADPKDIRAETGGNPLFVRELLSADHRQGATLMSLLATRYEHLDQEQLEVLDLASVIGAEFEATLLTSALGHNLSDVLEALERAEAAGIVAATPGRLGSFSFLHPLFRSARYEELPPSRRLQLHHDVATALERRAEDDRVVPHLARHACIAAPLGDARAAVGYARRAGQIAERSLAFDEAAAHYRLALEVADLVDPPDEQLRLRLTTSLASVLHWTGDPGYRDLLVRSADTARRLGDAHALGDIACAMAPYGTPITPGTSDPTFVEIAEEALEGLGPGPTAIRARTLAALSADLSIGGDPARALAFADEALTIARGLDDPVTLGHVLLAYRVSGRTPGNIDARQPVADQLIAIGRRLNEPVITICGMHERAWNYRDEGNFAASEEAIAAADALLHQHDVHPYAAFWQVIFRSMQQALTGDLAGAEDTAGTLLELAGKIGLDPTNFFGSALGTIRYRQGRLAELTDMLEAAAAQPGMRDSYSMAMALAYAHGGRLDDARSILRRYADDDFDGVPPNLFWPLSMGMLSQLAELTGDANAADRLLRHLLPFSGMIGSAPAGLGSPVDHLLAGLALTVGDVSRGERFAARAVEASRRRGSPLFLGSELIRLADARRRRGAPRDEVRPLVDEALAIAQRTGANLIVQEAERASL
jgi:DNA-binding CsgD family transcriptional regulator/tetratricopeptide (TPR) repeat protein